MTNFKWLDGNANLHGNFQVYKNDTWNELSSGYATSKNTNTTFTFQSDFNGSTGAYVTFVTVISHSLNKGVKLTTPGSQVSVALDTGSSTIAFRASVLISDDPKVNVTWSPSKPSATCYLSWNGSAWAFSGDGAPGTSGDTFNVEASHVTISVTNSQSGTKSSIYTSDNTGNTVGSIVAIASSSLSETFSGSSGSSTYIVNVFQPLDEAAELLVS